jgi:hypothetical protein
MPPPSTANPIGSSWERSIRRFWWLNLREGGQSPPFATIPILVPLTVVPVPWRYLLTIYPMIRCRPYGMDAASEGFLDCRNLA